MIPKAAGEYFEDGRVEISIMKVGKNKVIPRRPRGKAKDRTGEEFEFGQTQRGGFYLFSETDKSKKFIIPIEVLLDCIDVHINGPISSNPDES